MKQELRNQMLAHLAGMDAATVHRHSSAAVKRLTPLAVFADAALVAVYVSFGTEIETHDLIRQLLRAGRPVCVPAFSAGAYVVAEIRDFDQDLTAGQLGILEPRHLRRVPASRPDVWLVPGVAFDRNGNRLGRGKGYFDALLQHAPGVKISLAHDCQLVTKVPAEAHDVRMDWIVTENQVVQCSMPKEL